MATLLTLLLTAASTTVSAIAAALIQGVVLSTAGVPIASASVELERSDGSVVAKTSTGPRGDFSFAGVSAGSYVIVASAQGYLGATTPVSYNAENTQTIQVALTASSTNSLATIGSTVVNEQGGVNTSSAPSTIVPYDTFVTNGSAEIDQLLASQPGVTIEKLDGTAPGSESLLNIRGVGSSADLEASTGIGAADEVLVLQDGEPMISGNYGSYDLASLTPAIYSRAELIQGTGGTVLYGLPTIGGVLNLVTRDPLPSEGGLFSVGFGNNGLSDFNFLYSNRWKKFAFLADVHRYEIAGYLPSNYMASVIGFGGGPPGTPLPLQQGFNLKSALFKLEYDFSPVTKLIAGSSLESDLRDLSGSLIEPLYTAPGQIQTNPANGLPVVFAYAGSYPTNVTHNQPKETLDLSTSILGGALDVRWYTQVLTQDVTNYNSPAPSPPGNYYDLSNYDRLGGLLAAWTRVFGQNTVSLSATANSDVGTVQTISAAMTGAPLQTQINSQSSLIQRTYVARDDLTLGNLTLTGALFASDYNTLNLHRIDGRFAAVDRPDPNSVVRFSLGTGFAPPLVPELTTPLNLSAEAAEAPAQCPPTNINCAATAGNPNLQPESAFGVDAGYERLFGTGGRASIDFYQTTVINHIYEALVPAPSGLAFDDGTPVLYIIQPLNLGDVRFNGFQLAAALPLHDQLFLDGTYNTEVAYPFGLNANTQNEFQYIVNNQQLLGIPMHTFGATLRLANPAGAGAFFQWLFTSVNNQYGQPGFSIYNLGLTAPLGRQDKYSRDSLIVSVTNLFNRYNQYYTTPYGIPYPGYSGPYATNQSGVAPIQLTVTLQRKFGALH